MGRKLSVVVWVVCGLVVAAAGVRVVTRIADLPAGAAASAPVEEVLWGVLLAAFAVVATLIVTRQPRNVIGWLLAVPVLQFLIPAQEYVARFASPPAEPSLLLLSALWFGGWGWALLIFPTLFVLLLFPTGRPPTARWRWPVLLGVGMFALFTFFAVFAAEFGPDAGSPEGSWTVRNPVGFLAVDSFPMLLWTVLLGGLTLAGLASLVVRYRGASTVERAQMRWLLYACALFVVVYLAGLVVAESDSAPGRVVGVMLPVALAAVPVSIGFAVLRYRLWDIDVIIRRTLVYLPLSAILAGIFAASIRLLQSVLAAPGGGQSQTSAVLTTLVVVASFEPLKRWLQKVVDARFKDPADPRARWNAYRERLSSMVEMRDGAAGVRRLLEEATAAFEAEGGAAYVRGIDGLRLVHATGEMNGGGREGGEPGDGPPAAGVAVDLPLAHGDEVVGRLLLGRRRGGRPFEPSDLAALSESAAAVASLVALDGVGTGRGGA